MLSGKGECNRLKDSVSESGKGPAQTTYQAIAKGGGVPIGGIHIRHRIDDLRGTVEYIAQTASELACRSLIGCGRSLDVRKNQRGRSRNEDDYQNKGEIFHGDYK